MAEKPTHADYNRFGITPADLHDLYRLFETDSNDVRNLSFCWNDTLGRWEAHIVTSSTVYAYIDKRTTQWTKI